MATNNLPTTWKRAKFILNTTPELFMNWLDRRTLSRALSGNDEGNEPKRDFILGGEHYILGTTNGIASVRNGTNIIATTSIRLERFGTNSYKGPTVIKFYTDFIRPTELEVIIEWLDFSELAVWVNKLLEDIEQRWPEAALSRPPQIENGFLMRKPTLTLIEQSDNFGKRLELFRQDKLSDYKLLNKGNGRYQIRNNDSLMLEIQALPKEKDRLGRNQLELYLACPFEGMDVYEIFYDWVSHTYEGKFNSYIDEVTFPVQRITHALIEGFAKQETDNPQDEAIRQRFANIANKGLPDLPHDNVAASSQAESNEASGNKEISLATPNESGFESEMRSKDT
ncbi:MAG TPA: hypothetical protein VEC93_11290, partial [Anaerolineae bacterium]|nr:hypothetical protein [Anaerolineae bacterium]